jgi:TPR repeat protein
MYDVGKGVTQDFTQAFKYYTIGANANESYAQCNLGVDYLKGIGCIQDDVKAFELFKKSAEQGNAAGLANLGYMYESNRGGAGYDIDKAYMYYKQAADLGNEFAKNKLLNR